jgi:phage terminase small subunit
MTTPRDPILSTPSDGLPGGGDLHPHLPLSDAQEAFCQHYRVHFNATEAAKAAGYSARTAAAQASRLLRNVKVRARLAQLALATSERLELEAENVLREAMLVAFADIGNFVTWGEAGVTLVDVGDLPPGASRCVAEVSETVTRHGGTKRIKMHDKLAALDMLFRHLALYRDPGLSEPDRPRQEFTVCGQRFEL